jgi:tetratricopeptide (TPR) repeat protein
MDTLFKIPDAVIKEKIRTAICLLFKNDSFLLTLKENKDKDDEQDKKHVHERAIAHKLAEYLQQQFPEWHVDCEYNKHRDDPKRIKSAIQKDLPKIVIPDIVIHLRNSEQNLVIFEIKPYLEKTVNEGDNTKLIEFTNPKGEYKYYLGVFIGFDGTNYPQNVLYQNGKEVCKSFLRILFPFLLFICFTGTLFAQNDTGRSYTAWYDATVLYGIYDYKEAIQKCNQAIELNPKNADAYNLRGVIKYKLSDYRGAIQDYSKAIELNPNDTNAYFCRANSESMLKDYWPAALKDFSKAIELNPNDAAAYNNRGLTKINMGDKDGGCLDISKSGELGYSGAYDNIKSLCQ